MLTWDIEGCKPGSHAIDVHMGDDHDTSMPDAVDQQSSPFCFSCGYDLTGLDLPWACPECGCIADPEAQTENARRWFAGRRIWWWLTRTSRIPPGVCYVLHDATSRRLARRRVIVGLLLPALLTSLIVVAGTTIAIEYDVKSWYYDPADPDRKPQHVSDDRETDRLFNFNLNLHITPQDLLYPPPANWQKVKERTPSWIVFYPPPQLDSFAAMWCMFPWVFLTGYAPCWFVLSTLARRAGRRYARLELLSSVQAELSLPAIPMGIVSWGWLGLTLVWGIFCMSSPFVPGINVSMDALLWAWAVVLGITWVLVEIVVWPRMVASDRAGKIVPFPICVMLLLPVMSIGFPVGAIFMIRLVFWS